MTGKKGAQRWSVDTLRTMSYGIQSYYVFPGATLHSAKAKTCAIDRLRWRSHSQKEKVHFHANFVCYHTWKNSAGFAHIHMEEFLVKTNIDRDHFRMWTWLKNGSPQNSCYMMLHDFICFILILTNFWAMFGHSVA